MKVNNRDKVDHRELQTRAVSTRYYRHMLREGTQRARTGISMLSLNIKPELIRR